MFAKGIKTETKLQLELIYYSGGMMQAPIDLYPVPTKPRSDLDPGLARAMTFLFD